MIDNQEYKEIFNRVIDGTTFNEKVKKLKEIENVKQKEIEKRMEDIQKKKRSIWVAFDLLLLQIDLMSLSIQIANIQAYGIEKICDKR